MIAAAAGPILQASLHGRLGTFELAVELSLPGGVTALVGPSGCGKTTLLRCLSGLCRLDGTVTFGGEAWQDGRWFAPPHLRPVGYVFQEASLFAHLSVRGNLLFGLRRSRLRSGPSFDEIVALLDLGLLIDRSVAKLSGGERQRVAIGRALLVQPELLLMDEPVSSLDGESKAEVLLRLEQILTTLATPVIYVSHDPSEVTRFADRVLAMRGGQIVAAGEALEKTLDGLAEDEVRALAVAALAAGLRPSAARPNPPPE
jgi:molybdate transport system ATP-binding protein